MYVYREVGILKDKYTRESKEIQEISLQRKINIDIEKELFDKIEKDRDKIKEDKLSITDRLRNQFYKLRIKHTNRRMREATRNIINLGGKIAKCYRQRNEELKVEKQRIIDYLHEIMNLYKEDEKKRTRIKKMIRELEYIDVNNIRRIDMDVFEMELEYDEENGSFIPKFKIQAPTTQFAIPNEVQENGVTER